MSIKNISASIIIAFTFLALSQPQAAHAVENQTADPVLVFFAGVKTPADLDAYVSVLAEQDENVTSASVSEDQVSLGYRQRARLFGILPFSMPLTITVAKDGKIAASLPWYDFLSSFDEQPVLSNIQPFVGGLVSGDEFGVSSKATLLTVIRTVMKNNLEGKTTLGI